MVCLQPCISGHRRCGWPYRIWYLGLCVWSNSVWGPTALKLLATMHFWAPSLWVASLAAAIELVQCSMQQRYTFCNHTPSRENACKLPAGRAKWGFWLPGVQISTLDWLALLPVMSRAAYSFFMGPQPNQSCTRQSATNKATGALGGLQLIRRCSQPWNVS